MMSNLVAYIPTILLIVFVYAYTPSLIIQAFFLSKNSDYIYNSSLFIMRKKDFFEYCDYIFNILDEFCDYTGLHNVDDFIKHVSRLAAHQLAQLLIIMDYISYKAYSLIGVLLTFVNVISYP